MRILHVINSLGSGGAEKLICDYLTHESISKLYDHHLYLLSNKNNVFLDKISKLNLKISISKRKSLYNPLHIFDILYFLKLNKPNIVHAHLFPTLYFISIVSRIYKSPIYIFTEHNTQNRRMSKKYFQKLEILVYKRYDKLIAISDAVKSSLSEWIKSKDKDEIIVVNNGIDLRTFSDAKKIDLRNELGLNSDTILLVMVARFSEQKDHESVIEAVAMLPSNVYLLLVGEGPRMSLIKNKSINMGLKKRVIFLCFRSDIAEIYKSVDIAILYSHYEGFGLSALEAIASSTPLIVSNSLGMKDIVSSFGRVKVATSSKEIYISVLKTLSESLNENLKYQKNLNNYSIEKYSTAINSVYKSFFDKF